MLGSSTAAVTTFDGQHVPFYVTYLSGDYRCKPYRKSVQYCRTCDDIGHRQDIFPHPKANFCYKSGSEGYTEAHDCQPKFKICGEDHETAAKECKKKLRSSPPPYQVRRQQLNNARAREHRWSSDTDDILGLAASSENPQAFSLHRDPGRSRSQSKQKRSSRSRTPSWSRSGRRITYAATVSGSNGCSSQCITSAFDVSPAERATIRELENKVPELQRTVRERPPAECGTPDLEDRIVQRANWTRLPDTLFSDHNIIEIDVEQTHRLPKSGKARLTDWNAFRKELGDDSTIDDIEAWLNEIVGVADSRNKMIQLDEDNPAVDNHLLHLWEASHHFSNDGDGKGSTKSSSLELHTYNAGTRVRRTASEPELAMLLKTTSGTLSTKMTWHSFRALIDDAHTKTQRRHTIQRLIHSYDSTGEQLLQELETKLRDSDSPQATSNNRATSRECQGAPNEEVDRPFTQAELHAALR
ncbi:hypothetical protein HPB52_002512 [Rhipicephalus sanguineus]|uniref:Uncharacterized protein n=1 Tax=Rhipicephalus sanguineus TaxID=34632 RepID=A0A9D4SM55_RHISA|nr:hypothetical protein HPB52_002512 [Rhipicephalus sanguineus]